MSIRYFIGLMVWCVGVWLLTPFVVTFTFNWILEGLPYESVGDFFDYIYDALCYLLMILMIGIYVAPKFLK